MNGRGSLDDYDAYETISFHILNLIDTLHVKSKLFLNIYLYTY